MDVQSRLVVLFLLQRLATIFAGNIISLFIDVKTMTIHIQGSPAALSAQRSSVHVYKNSRGSLSGSLSVLCLREFRFQPFSLRSAL